jgi:two-component system nitrate/nitrite response regulator NarL
MQYEQSGAGPLIRVLIADSTRIHSQLLAEALRRDRHLEIVAAVSTSHDLIAAAKPSFCDVLVVSANLDEDPLRGFKVLRQLRAADSELRAIALMDSCKREIILEAFRAGARGVFSRHESLETLSKCVTCVHNGQIWANSEQMGFAVEALAASPTVRAVNANGLNLLSKRELDVVRSLAEGLTNREIAERLGLSQHTIKNYLFRVFDKLGVSSRMELLFLTLAQPVANSSGNGANGKSKHTVEWCLQAAEEGIPTAQVALARMHSQGKGVEKDPVTAYMWYLISERTSLAMKDEISAAKRQLAESLTTEEILEAQQRANDRLHTAAKQQPASSRLSRAAEVSA